MSDQKKQNSIIDGLKGMKIPTRSTPKPANKNNVNTEPAVGDTFILDLKNIIVEDQVRKDFNKDKLSELAKQISQEGQRNPLEVSKVGDNKYLLITGERRYRALTLNKLNTARVTLVELPEGIQNRIAFQLTENLQRDDLTALELAEAFDQLKSLGWSQTQIAKKIGKSHGWVSRYSSLIGLPEHIEILLLDGHTSDIQIIGTLRKINDISPKASLKLSKKVQEGSTSRQMISDAYNNLKAQLGTNAGETNTTDAIDLQKTHYERKHTLIRADNFKAEVEAKLADGNKIRGHLLTDRLAQDEQGNDSSWCWVAMEDGSQVCVETDKIKILSVSSS